MITSVLTPCVCSYELGWEHLAGYLASPTLLLLCRSLWVLWSPSFVEWVRLNSCFMEWDSLKSLKVFYASKSVGILLKIISHSIYTFLGVFYLIILLQIWYMFLETNRHFTLKKNSDICDALSVQINHEHEDCIVNCGHGKKCLCCWEWQYFRIPFLCVMLHFLPVPCAP